MAGISSFSGLNVSLRALLAEQRSMDVTAHNIANVNTAGYTRQEATLGAALPLTLPSGALQNGSGAQLGQGVDVLAYRRMRDQFGDLQFRAQTMTQGQQETTARALDQAQSLLSEPGDNGLTAALGKFYSAWQDLADRPESSATRGAVIGRAQEVVTQLHQLAAGLTGVQSSAAAQTFQLTGSQGPVANAAAEIAQLNLAIRQAVGAGQQPNDLLDRRDVLIDGLSKLGQVSVTDLGNGSTRIGFGDAAAPLVDDTTVTWPQPLTSAAGGQLGALAEIASPAGKVAGYLSDLDAAASALASTVNAIHPTAFFSGTTAATIAVAATPSTVVAGTGGAAGANDVALAIGDLRSSAALGGYADVVRRMGADTAEAERRADTATTLAAAADERRQSVGGVSMDEEMTNVVKFQRGYQAASRAMSTMDEMLDQLISRTGRVGL